MALGRTLHSIRHKHAGTHADVAEELDRKAKVLAAHNRKVRKTKPVSRAGAAIIKKHITKN